MSTLAGLMAAELGADVTLQESGLLHDIGKAVDHEMEGSHITPVRIWLYKEETEVINTIQAHHETWSLHRS